VEQSQVRGGDKKFSAFVDIFTNNFPPNQFGSIGPVWMGLASTATLNEEGKDSGNICPAFFMCPDWPSYGGHRLKASWSMSSLPPFLPEQLVEYADNQTFQIVSANYYRWTKKMFPSVYAEGYTNCIYTVLSWTNWSGISVPQHFRLIGFVPDLRSDDRNRVQTQTVYDGYVESVSETISNSVTMPEQFLAWSRISEGRYSEKPIVYVSKSGGLWPKDEVLGRGAELDIDVAAATAGARKHRSVIFGGLLFVLGGLPAGLILLTRFRRTNEKPKQA